MGLPKMSPEEEKMLECMVVSKRKTMDVLQKPSNMFASNVPLMMFGGAWFHSKKFPERWPASLRVDGIHRRKFVIGGAIAAFALPIFHRLFVSSNVLKETMTEYGYNFPPTNEDKKLINKVMKQLRDDPEAATLTKINSLPLYSQNIVQNFPVQSSDTQNQAPNSQNLNIYENQNNQNSESYQYSQTGNMNYNRWSDNPQGTGNDENTNKPKQFKSWDDYGK